MSPDNQNPETEGTERQLGKTQAVGSTRLAAMLDEAEMLSGMLVKDRVHKRPPSSHHLSYEKAPKTAKQKKARAKAKRARKSRKKNRR